MAQRNEKTIYGVLGVLGIDTGFWRDITGGRFRNYVWSRILRGFSQECLRRETAMALIPAGGRAECYADARKVASTPVDGILLLRYLDDRDLFVQALASGKSLIAATQTAARAHIPFVDFDHVNSVGQAASLLRLKGLRRIALVMEDFIDEELSKRTADAFCSTARENGQTVSLWRCQFSREPAVRKQDGIAAVRQLLADQARPEAIVFKGDGVAEGGITQLRSASLRIPQDIAVIVDCPMETPFFAGREREYTRFCFPAEEIGLAAAQFLLQPPRERKAQGLLLTHQLIRGDSA